jgi:hypothetical protein
MLCNACSERILLSFGICKTNADRPKASSSFVYARFARILRSQSVGTSQPSNDLSPWTGHAGIMSLCPFTDHSGFYYYQPDTHHHHVNAKPSHPAQHRLSAPEAWTSSSADILDQLPSPKSFDAGAAGQRHSWAADRPGFGGRHWRPRSWAPGYCLIADACDYERQNRANDDVRKRLEEDEEEEMKLEEQVPQQRKGQVGNDAALIHRGTLIGCYGQQRIYAN